MIKGIPVSEGYAFAKVLRIIDDTIDTTKKIVSDPNQEINHFHEAIDKTVFQLNALKDETEKKFGIDTAKIFEAHIMIAEDPEIKNLVEEKIKTESCNLVYALKSVVDFYIDLFKDLDDEYLRERASDLVDVSSRMIKNALNLSMTDLSKIRTNVILVAHDLTPSQTAQIDSSRVLGFITEIGGKTSHSAIIARILGIPAVVGASKALEFLTDGDEIILDGMEGYIIKNYHQSTQDEYIQKIRDREQQHQALKSMIGKPTLSLDQHPYQLVANIGSSRDLKHVKEHDAEGIGLFRTEFLFLDRNALPSEEEQFIEYKKVLEKMNPKPVVIRTLDIGGDKNLSYLKFEQELNPFLGKRAIRLCLEEIDLFKTQLRALVRASAYGNLKIMFPMIATLEEFLKAKALLTSIQQELDEEKIPYHPFELGIMIEIPVAALNAHHLAKHVDFFSIGTNDLIQYTMAADRMNQSLDYLYQPFHPAILRLIKMVADAAKKYHIWSSVCGEMASDLLAAPLLLGLGIQELSMIPNNILKTRKLLSTLKHLELEKIALSVLELESEEQVISLLRQHIHL
jgi:phosphoenolpyruvate-protein phosphotransferase (PTS system enzyme I)